MLWSEAKAGKCVHYIAVICPLGIIRRGDPRSAHADHENCQNGYIYKRAGVFTVLFHTNSGTKVLQTMGEIDSSTVYMTFPRFYDDQPEREVYVSAADRIELLDQDMLVVEEQLIESHRAGIDRAHYPIVDVQLLIDSHGIEFKKGDFIITGNGRLQWVGKRPEFDPRENIGGVYSIRYLYRPFWLIKTIVKDIRISRKPGSDGRELQKMPISVISQREYCFKNEYDAKPEGDRKAPIPPDGGFGTR